MKRRSILLALLVISATASGASAGPNEEVAAAAQQWATQFSAASPDALVALYDKKAVLWGTRARKLSADSGAIREYYTETFRTIPRRKVTLEEQRIRLFGDVAVNTGTYTFSFVDTQGRTRTAPGRYSFVFVKRDGKWIIVDHHSSAMPRS